MNTPNVTPTLDAFWRSFRAQVYPMPLPAQQEQELYNAFFAGALSFSRCLELLSSEVGGTMTCDITKLEQELADYVQRFLIKSAVAVEH